MLPKSYQGDSFFGMTCCFSVSVSHSRPTYVVRSAQDMDWFWFFRGLPPRCGSMSVLSFIIGMQPFNFSELRTHTIVMRKRRSISVNIHYTLHLRHWLVSRSLVASIQFSKLTRSNPTRSHSRSRIRIRLLVGTQLHRIAKLRKKTQLRRRSARGT